MTNRYNRGNPRQMSDRSFLGMWLLIIAGLVAIAATGGAFAMVLGIPLTLVALYLLFKQSDDPKPKRRQGR